MAILSDNMPRTRAEHEYASHEPIAPSVSTAVPGPATEQAKSSLDGFFDARAVQLVVDYEKSQGN